MSVADKDGRIAQQVADMQACLSMEIHESLREGLERVEALIDAMPRRQPWWRRWFRREQS